MSKRLPTNIVFPYRVEVRDPVLGWQVCGVHEHERFAIQRYMDVLNSVPHCAVVLSKIHPTVPQCWTRMRSYEPPARKILPAVNKMSRQQIINELEEHSRAAFAEEPENADFEAARQYWNMKTDEALRFELLEARTK